MQSSFNPYPDELLPPGFKYPKSYLKIASQPDLIVYKGSYHFFEWIFESYGTQGSKLAYQSRNDHLPNTNLIPFAYRATRWGAYFDGDDTSGDPRTIVVDFFRLPNHSVHRSFDVWLSLALQDYWWYF